MARKNYTGSRFGRWTVVQDDGLSMRYWLCQCECGQKRMINGSKLIRGDTKSCGCFSRDVTKVRMTTHGLVGHWLYKRWAKIYARCYYPSNKSYKNYGGRGIVLCERWLDVRNFVADNQHVEDRSLTIDRIDNSGPYSPENCRWVGQDIQQLNRRSNAVFTFQGRAAPLSVWAREYGIKLHTLRFRLLSGWPMEEALTKPLRRNPRWHP
jgi:hypothetical protein